MSKVGHDVPGNHEALLGALAANEITDGQLEALCDLLVEDTPASRDLARHIRNTLLIRGWLRAESDPRFSMETAKLIRRLRQDSGRTFVLDTMQRVRCAAQKGTQATKRTQSARSSRQSTAQLRPGRRRTSILPYLLTAVASAACVLAAFHLGWLQPSTTGFVAGNSQAKPADPQPTGVEVVVATDARQGNARPLKPGDRLHAGDMVVTGPAGLVKLRYDDDTSMELRTGGELILLTAKTTAGALEPSKDFLLRAGELVAAVSPQPADQPVVISTPHATVTVVGTQFSVHVLDTQTRLQVTEGTVRLQRGSQHLLVEKDTLAIADASGLRKAGPTEGRPYEDLMAKLSFAKTSGDGQWSVRLTGEGPVLCQTDAACDAAWIRLAPPLWKSGYLTGQCRLAQATDSGEHTVAWQALVHASPSSDQEVAHPIPYMTEAAATEPRSERWFDINIRFHVSDDHRLYAECLQSWHEGMPPPLGRIGTTEHESTDPRVPPTPAIQDVDLFGLSIECHQAAVEFRALRFYPEPDVPELQFERTIPQRIAAQKGSGLDARNATAFETGVWHLAETDEGLQILREDSDPGPSELNVGVIPHRRVLLSGQIMALPPGQAEGVPAVLADERTRVPCGKEKLSIAALLQSRRGGRTDSPCFLAVPVSDPSGRTATIMHFHSCEGGKFGIPETGTWYHFVVFLNSDDHGNRIQGHAYWPEGKPAGAIWCMPRPEPLPESSRGPFTLKLYTNGQRILWRNLKIVPY